MDFERLYFLLFNSITDAVASIDRKDYTLARQILISAQQQTEELYITSGEPEM